MVGLAIVSGIHAAATEDLGQNGNCQGAGLPSTAGIRRKDKFQFCSGHMVADTQSTGRSDLHLIGTQVFTADGEIYGQGRRLSR